MPQRRKGERGLGWPISSEIYEVTIDFCLPKTIFFPILSYLSPTLSYFLILTAGRKMTQLIVKFRNGLLYPCGLSSLGLFLSEILALKLSGFSSHSGVNTLRIPDLRPKTGSKITKQVPGPQQWQSRQGMSPPGNFPEVRWRLCIVSSPLCIRECEMEVEDTIRKALGYSLFQC